MRPRGSLLHWLGALARNLSRGTRRDAELRADVDSYVDLLTDDKIAAGLPPPKKRAAFALVRGWPRARRTRVTHCGSSAAISGSASSRF